MIDGRGETRAEKLNDDGVDMDNCRGQAFNKAAVIRVLQI